MRTLPTLCCLSLALASHAADKPLLDRLTVHSTGPVTLTIPADQAPQSPIYHAASGQWKPLDVTFANNRATFTLPSPSPQR